MSVYIHSFIVNNTGNKICLNQQGAEERKTKVISPGGSNNVVKKREISDSKQSIALAKRSEMFVEAFMQAYG